MQPLFTDQGLNTLTATPLTASTRSSSSVDETLGYWSNQIYDYSITSNDVFYGSYFVYEYDKSKVGTKVTNQIQTAIYCNATSVGSYPTFGGLILNTIA
jgi:hypothetical protein